MRMVLIQEDLEQHPLSTMETRERGHKRNRVNTAFYKDRRDGQKLTDTEAQQHTKTRQS